GNNTATATYGSLSLNADGTGGTGGSGPAGQADGGQGSGGYAFINAKGTTHVLNEVYMGATGTGGTGANGGIGQGGFALLESFAGSSMNLDGDVAMDA